MTAIKENPEMLNPPKEEETETPGDEEGNSSEMPTVPDSELDTEPDAEPEAEQTEQAQSEPNNEQKEEEEQTPAPPTQPEPEPEEERTTTAPPTQPEPEPEPEPEADKYTLLDEKALDKMSAEEVASWVVKNIPSQKASDIRGQFFRWLNTKDVSFVNEVKVHLIMLGWG